MAQDKSVDEVAGAHIHSVKECAAFPLPFVDIHGRNIGSLSHRMFCTRRTKADLAKIADEQRLLEVDPYLVNVRQSASRMIRDGADLSSLMRANEREMAGLIKRYKASLETDSSDVMGQQGDSHDDQSVQVLESEEEGIPDFSPNLIE